MWWLWSGIVFFALAENKRLFSREAEQQLYDDLLAAFYEEETVGVTSDSSQQEGGIGDEYLEEEGLQNHRHSKPRFQRKRRKNNYDEDWERSDSSGYKGYGGQNSYYEQESEGQNMYGMQQNGYGMGRWQAMNLGHTPRTEDGRHKKYDQRKAQSTMSLSQISAGGGSWDGNSQWKPVDANIRQTGPQTFELQWKVPTPTTFPDDGEYYHNGPLADGCKPYTELSKDLMLKYQAMTQMDKKLDVNQKIQVVPIKWFDIKPARCQVLGEGSLPSHRGIKNIYRLQDRTKVAFKIFLDSRIPDLENEVKLCVRFKQFSLESGFGVGTPNCAPFIFQGDMGQDSANQDSGSFYDPGMASRAQHKFEILMMFATHGIRLERIMKSDRPPRGFQGNELKLFQGLVRALQKANAAGVFHMDIKPRSVLYNEVDSTLHLTDFRLGVIGKPHDEFRCLPECHLIWSPSECHGGVIFHRHGPKYRTLKGQGCTNAEKEKFSAMFLGYLMCAGWHKRMGRWPGYEHTRQVCRAVKPLLYKHLRKIEHDWKVPSLPVSSDMSGGMFPPAAPAAGGNAGNSTSNAATAAAATTPAAGAAAKTTTTAKPAALYSQKAVGDSDEFEELFDDDNDFYDVNEINNW